MVNDILEKFDSFEFLRWYNDDKIGTMTKSFLLSKPYFACVKEHVSS